MDTPYHTLRLVTTGEPVLILLKTDICEPDRKGVNRIRSLYAFVQKTFEETPTNLLDFKGLKYLYEQHMCPKNFIGGVEEFILETSPKIYYKDPHGLFKVVGWITVADARTLHTDSKGVLSLETVINKILEDFKEPPDDWMADVGMEPEPEGQRVYAFVDRLRAMVLTRLTQMGTTDQHGNQYPIISPERADAIRNNTDPLLLQLDQLFEVAEALGVNFNFKQ